MPVRYLTTKVRGAMSMLRWSFPVLCALSACALDSNGTSPVEGEFYYPAELATAPAEEGDAPPYLFVSNENFDLRYNSGTVISFDLDAVSAAARACTEPTPCELKPADFRRGEVRTGSFAGGLEVSSRGDRLYAPFRSAGGLTRIDIGADGSLSCSESNATFAECDDEHSRLETRVADLRDVSFPRNAVRVEVIPLAELDANAAEDSGDALIIADRSGAVSLVVDRASGGSRGTPELVDVLSGLPTGIAGLDVLSRRQEAWITSTRTGAISRVGILLDSTAPSLETSSLFLSGTAFVRGFDNGSDTRDLRFIGNSSRVVFISRRPESILVASALNVLDVVPVEKFVDVDSGPSRLATGIIGGRELAFVTCYDAKALWIIDLGLGRDVGVVRGFSGPFDVEVDAARELLYVADFRSSTVRIVDLAPLANPESVEVPRIIAMLGSPLVPGEGR